MLDIDISNRISSQKLYETLFQSETNENESVNSFQILQASLTQSIAEQFSESQSENGSNNQLKQENQIESVISSSEKAQNQIETKQFKKIQFVTAGWNGTICHFEYDFYNQKIKRLRIFEYLHNGWNINTINYIKQKDILISAGNDYQINFFNFKNMTQIKKLDSTKHMNEYIFNIKVSPDQKYFSVMTNEVLKIYCFQTYKKEKVIQNGNIKFIFSHDFSQDGNFLLVTDFAGSLYIWKLQRPAFPLIQKFKFQDMSNERKYFKQIFFNPTNQFEIITLLSKDNAVCKWNLPLTINDNSQLSFNPHKRIYSEEAGEIKMIEISKKGEQIVASLKKIADQKNNYFVELYDAEFKKLNQSQEFHQTKIKTIVFDENGRFIASASEDGVVKIWDSERLEKIGEFYHMDFLESLIIIQ